MATYYSQISSNLPDVTLMLLGKTGAGKSSIGNAILNLSSKDSQFTVTHNMYATPVYDAVAKSCFVHDRKVTVVDTPGVMDPKDSGNDERSLAGICSGIMKCPEGVDVFLLVMRLDSKLTQEELQTVAKLESLFGSHFWQHVILLFTHGDHVENSQQVFDESMSQAAAHLPEFQKLVAKLEGKTFQGQVRPHFIDSRSKADPDVVKKQIQAIMTTVDTLVKTNEKKKYTNELFKTAQQQLRESKIGEIERDKQKAESELLLLRDQVKSLELMRQTDTKTISDLQRKVVDCEAGLSMVSTLEKTLDRDAKTIDCLEKKVTDYEAKLVIERQKMETFLLEQLKKNKCPIL